MKSARGAFTAAGLRTVADLLREGAARHPARTLLVYEDPAGAAHSFTWAEVVERSRALAGCFAAAGLRRGDRVHVHLGNRPEFLFAWFGAALGGYSIVPTNTASSAAEIAYIAGHAETRLSLTEEAHLETVVAARAEAGGEVPILCCERDRLVDAPVLAVPPAVPPSGADELGIIYTSGTTSRPKGAIVSHANYVYSGEVVSKALALCPGDRLIVALPLFHANAQYYSTMGALAARSTLILLPRFSASRFIDQCIAYEATVASLFAAPIRMILAQEPRPNRRHHLRVVLFAQNIGDDELARWELEIDAPLLQLYGMTETIGPPLMNPLWGERRADKVGRVSLGYSCRVVDERGADVAVGERGELLVGGIPGVSLVSGYLRDPEATAKAIVDGWLHTGDIVSVDERGYFAFVDRDKDMIKRAGENVAASEVEAALLEHPGVADVAVVGVPEEMRDEAIIAFVVLGDADAAPEELRGWCAERLAKFRVPSEVVPLPELPRTAVGKIQKHKLRASYRPAGVTRG